MKASRKLDYFEKESPRTAAEIKAALEKARDNKTDFDIRSNGSHIWIELGQTRQKYWSPMLHLRLEDSGKQTFIKGEFAENPMLWVVFLLSQIVSVGVFLVALAIAWFKSRSGTNFNTELFLMFAMVTVWFAVYLISERYKRKGATQIGELQDFVDDIAAA